MAHRTPDVTSTGGAWAFQPSSASRSGQQQQTAAQPVRDGEGPRFAQTRGQPQPTGSQPASASTTTATMTAASGPPTQVSGGSSPRLAGPGTLPPPPPPVDWTLLQALVPDVPNLPPPPLTTTAGFTPVPHTSTTTATASTSSTSTTTLQPPPASGPPPPSSPPPPLPQQLVSGGVATPTRMAMPPAERHLGFVFDPKSLQLDGLVRHIRNSQPGDEPLRLHLRTDGLQELYLHDPGGPAHSFGFGASKQRQEKTEPALQLVRGLLSVELGSTKAADDMLKSIGADDKAVPAAALLKIEARREAAAMARDLAGRQARLGDGTSGLDGQDQIRPSGDGKGGVLIATHAEGSGRAGVALKFHSAEELEKATFVGTLASTVIANAVSPLPFRIPAQELIDVAKAPALGKRMQDALADVAAKAGDRTVADRAKDYSDKLQKYGQVLKSEFFDGTTLNKLPASDHLKLLRDEGFARTLGQGAILLPALGFGDHLGLDGVPGNVNFANIMRLEDGSLALIDLDAYKVGSSTPSYGINDEQLRTGVESLLKFVKDLGSDKKSTEVMAKLMKAADEGDLGVKGNPLGKIMHKMAAPGPDQFFAAKADMKAQGVDRKDFERFALNLAIGAVEGLACMQENQAAFQAAHAAVQDKNNLEDPEKTFRQVGKEIAAADLGKLKAALEARLGEL